MDELLSSLEPGKNRITGLRGSSAALLAARARAKTGRPILCVAPSERRAELLEQDISLFTEQPVIHYPGYDIPPYIPLSPDPGTVAARLAALYQILTAEKPLIIIASAEALLRRVIPKNRLANLAELVLSGEETDRQELAQRLTAAGYEHVALVQSVGDFSIRGGIVDVFPPGTTNPVRLDFFGDTVESIRTFDPITQRSVEQLAEVVFLPASNILFPPAGRKQDRQAAQNAGLPADTTVNWQGPELASILEKINTRRRFPGIEFYLPLFYQSLSQPLDYIDPATLVLLIDPLEISHNLEITWERIEANFAESAAAGTPALRPETIFLSEKALNLELDKFDQIRLPEFAALEDSGPGYELPTTDHRLIKQEIELTRKKQGLLAPLTAHIADWHAQGGQVMMACRSARHAANLADLLSQHGLNVSVRPLPIDLAQIKNNAGPEVMLYASPLARGFSLPDEQLHFLSETELFGEQRLGGKKINRKKSTAGQEQVESHDELRDGEIVVHRDHGLGVYGGLVTMELQGITNDFLQITYQGDDKLYIPVDRIHIVTKYKGLSDKKPKLDKLGGKTWILAKKKVKDAVRQVALDLLHLYAKRELKEGRSFSRPDELFHELEESFPFEETAGQQKAINEVLADLCSTKPMDRLVCGDVGYGKTEVSVRAAFKVVEDGFQVAVLVPTTVLAEQHAQTFRERFEGFPVQVESLNRFRSQAQQRLILQGLRDGRVDIVIGTHRLLSKDVTFKNLGLLVIDEEHRFGVSHKEKIKRLRAEIDILTLTATPIPRTLQMSLLSIRDLSVISTPPEHRRKILTFVARHDDLVIKEAVSRELQRGGQVFIVHNRVRSIGKMASQVQKLVPRARIAVAHGQMPARSLEDTMGQFINREVDVLVCTTIIESGLDISNANTIIISQADRLGLAEIYQLRGRVGRSSEQSYAYLLVPSMDGLTKDARDRLRALMDCSDLGGGFKLAMSDLQIRGGGNILGISQSGHIAAVGYDLYLDLLQKTVADLKHQAEHQEERTDEIEPEINLKLSAYIPEHYIRDVDQRYIAYRRIAGVTSAEELADLNDELQDRYGRLPEETSNLLEIMALKTELKKLQASKLEQGKGTVVLTFHPQSPVSPEKILALMENSKGLVRFTPDARLIVRLPEKTPESPQLILNTARGILAELAG